MYLIPFWSYRPTATDVVITNSITNHKRSVPQALLEALHDLHVGRAPGACTDEARQLGRELGILFESEAVAEAHLRAQEDAWQRDVPVVDQIELTNRCPYSCKMCPRTSSMDRALGNMSLGLFGEVIEQIAGHQPYVGLHHFGESLLHEGLPQAISLADAAGVKTGLSCNPPSLHPALAQRILKSGIANLVLSLDSLDAATYRSIRGKVALFDRANDHVRELIKLRNEGNFSTFISLQMIRMHVNAGEADRFLDYCREVGVDRGVVIRLGRWDFEDEQMAELGEYTSPGYTAWCNRPWTSLVVLWDGRVVPCCHDYNGAVILGDLTKQSLAEIWQGEAARRFRAQNSQYELCRRCAFSRYYRQNQRDQEGFMQFHRERHAVGGRREWFNDQSPVRDTCLFDGFDVWGEESQSSAADQP